MNKAEYYLRIGNEIRKIWGWNQFIYPENRSTDRYPFFNGTTIRNAIPFNSNHLDSFSFYGCNLGENAAFVPWIDNKISVYNTFPNRIAVSFGFSGCYMVKYFFQERCYISHIQSGMGDCKHIWNDLCIQNRGKIKIHALFRPTDNNDFISAYKSSLLNDDIKCTIAGVIMPDNKCFAVLVNVRTHMPIYINEITRKIPFLITN